jgi:hypothetical protein
MPDSLSTPLAPQNPFAKGEHHAAGPELESYKPLQIRQALDCMVFIYQLRAQHQKISLQRRIFVSIFRRTGILTSLWSTEGISKEQQ